MIHAPAGYGKTTLAAQWANELSQDGALVGWLAIDDNDNNPAWFLSNLLEAVRRVSPAAVSDLGRLLEENGENQERYVLTSLVNQIADVDERMVIVIDDWHRITSATVTTAMTFLLEYSPDNLQLVVTTRRRSGLPLSSLRVHDELTEIKVAALCFDYDEARALLVDVAGLDLRNVDVTGLLDSTDGWVAGLQLASLSLRGVDNAEEMIDDISGRHHAIAEYLTENVLSSLEPETLRFLLVTSITERICGPLATALSGESHGRAMLEDVEARDLFLSRSDGDGDWFQYHHLFAEFLQRRLDRDHPELIATLHRTASEWFAGRHMLVEAVDHAVAAGDDARAVELVEAGGLTLLADSQMTTLFGIVDKLPSKQVVSSPQLQLIVAWANILLQRPQSARAALSGAAAALSALEDAGTDVSNLRALAGVEEANLRAYTDRMTGLEHLLRDCLATPEEFPMFAVSAAANLMTHCAIYRFDFAAVHRWQEWARPYHEQNTGPYIPAFGHARKGLAWFEQLDLRRAEQEFRTAFQVASRQGTMRHTQGARLAGAPLAELLYALGQTEEAEELLEESFKVGSDEGMVEWIRARFVVGARLAVLHGERTVAADLLDEAAEAAMRLSVPRLAAAVENERVRLGLPTRRVPRPPVDYHRRACPADGIAELTAQLDEDTAIMLLIAGSPPPEQVDRACRWAEEWVDRLRDRGRDRALLQAQRTLAECLMVAGRTAEAMTLVGSILSRCAECGMVRFLLDSGDRLLPLVAEIRAGARIGSEKLAAPRPPDAFLDRVLEAAGESRRPGPGDQSAVIDHGVSPVADVSDGPRLTVLGGDRPGWLTIDRWGRPRRRILPGRHADILVLLGQRPEGLTADHLGMLLGEQELDSVTVRAEISRLRKTIGPEFLGSRPYRLLKPISSDLGDVLTALLGGDVDAMLSNYSGPLLPRSVSPGIARLRARLSTSVRRAAISCENLTALQRWLNTPEGHDDREGWQTLHTKSQAYKAIRACAEGHLASIDLALG